jgi:hypothetical protein
LKSVVSGKPSAFPTSIHALSRAAARDVAGQYESSGAPYAGNIYGSASIISPFNRGSQLLLAPNQSAQSFVGVKVEESLTDRLTVIARLEMGFNATTGEISDALKSLQNANGVPLNQQNVNADGPRAGQILNGEAWGGFQDKAWVIRR